MIECMYRKPHWDYWISIWCESRVAALCQRDWLRDRGCHAEVI